jgi:hypothetical protein
MNKMVLSVLAALVAVGASIASVDEASAFVCARGPYRAGCAGPHGAVGFIAATTAATVGAFIAAAIMAAAFIAGTEAVGALKATERAGS